MKRYQIFVLIFFLCLTAVLSSVKANSTLPLVGKKIIIDPGHGFLDPGTTFGDIYEKDINLKISLYLKDELSKSGASVILTRDGDYDLSSPKAMFRKKSDFDNRISLINDQNPDLYLSIHLNYLSDNTYFGPQVFYKKEDLRLANIMQSVLNNYASSNRNIKLMPVDIYMYKRLKPSGLLIECGFLSNQYERGKLVSESYQKGLAKAINDALIIYFN